MKNQNIPLRLLVENEIFRLSVWSNPTNDAKRGNDHIGAVEKMIMDVSVNVFESFIVLTLSSRHGLARFARCGK